MSAGCVRKISSPILLMMEMFFGLLAVWRG
jgi:hypothetical protein